MSTTQREAVQCPQCGVRRNQRHRGWCSGPAMLKLPVEQTMSNTQREKLLKLYDEASQSMDGKSYHVNRALWHLLEHYKDRLPKLDYYFHKAFRQIDVTDSGHTDMAVWHLIHAAAPFWDAFYDARKQPKRRKK